MRSLCLLPAASLLIATASLPAQNTITVQVVDDSGMAHSPYIVLKANDLTFGPAPSSGQFPSSVLGDTGQTPATTISQLPPASFTIVSPYTGQTRTVYEFEIEEINSGNFYIFKNDGNGAPFTFDGSSPSTTDNFRYDLCELTYGASIDSVADLTSIDMLGFQFQLEKFNNGVTVGANTLPDDARYYYRSTKSLVDALDNLSNDMTDSFFEVGATDPESGWDPDTDSMDTFLRAKGPNQLAAVPGNGFSPAPYPSFASYLDSLAGNNDGTQLKFRVEGQGETAFDESAVSTYDYEFQIWKTANGGYQAKSVASSQTTANTGSIKFKNSGGQEQTEVVPVGADVVINLPAAANATASVEMTPSPLWPGVSGTSGIPPFLPVVEDGNNLSMSGDGYSTNVIVPAPQSGSGTTAQVAVNLNASGAPINFTDIEPNFPLKLVDPGSGYTDFIEITVPNSDPSKNAKYYLFLDDATVASVAVDDGGSGYFGSAVSSSLATVIPPPTVVTPSSNPAVISEVTANADGEISGLTLQAGSGTNYQAAPTVELKAPPGGYDFNIYGATLSSAVVTIIDASTMDSWPYFDEDTNIVYGAMARDILSALNFGYIDSVYETNDAENWFAATPTLFPYALARNNDGFYNPWAAIMYQYSDAYSFAFTDKAGPNPLLPLTTGDTIRITLLPDERLDSPQPHVPNPGSDSLKVQWQKVEGATGYEIKILAPLGIPAPPTLPANTTNYKFKNLDSGTPHTISVVATGKVNRTAVKSPAQLIRVSTTGSPPALTSSDTIDASIAWASSQIPPDVNTANLEFHINDQVFDYTTGSNKMSIPATFSASQGSPPNNQYVFRVVETSASGDKTLFSDIITLDIVGTQSQFGVYDVEFFGNAPNSVALQGGTNGSFDNTTFNLGITFNGLPTKAFGTVKFPGASYAEWAGKFPGLTLDDPQENPDLDTHANLMEYFIGGNPTLSDLGQFPEIERVDDRTLKLTYPVGKDTSDVQEQVQFSYDLVEWYDIDAVIGPDRDLGETFERSAFIPYPPNENLFLRLNVMQTD